MYRVLVVDDEERSTDSLAGMLEETIQYQNRRADYFEAWWRLVDWPEVSRLYTGCLACRPPRP